MMSSTRVLVRQLVRLTIALIIVGIVVSDALKVAPALKAAGDAVGAAMGAAMTASAAAPDVPDSGYQPAVDAAAAHGGTVEAYSQQAGEVRGSRAVALTISVSTPVGRTLLAAPILGIINGIPADGWYAPTGSKIILTETKRVDVY